MNTSLKATSFTQTLARMMLQLKSWKLEVNLPPTPKYVLIGAPHTTNWDLFYALLLLHATRIKPHFVAKDTLFREPLGSIMRWLGGIPVDRQSRNNFVQQIVEVYNRMEELVVAIAPEGTRSLTRTWKTGFYYIAMGAQVPIAMGFVDYPRKVVGIGPTLWPSGDIHADFAKIKAFYSQKVGRYPHLTGEIRIQPE